MKAYVCVLVIIAAAAISEAGNIVRNAQINSQSLTGNRLAPATPLPQTRDKGDSSGGGSGIGGGGSGIGGGALIYPGYYPSYGVAFYPSYGAGLGSDYGDLGEIYQYVQLINLLNGPPCKKCRIKPAAFGLPPSKLPSGAVPPKLPLPGLQYPTKLSASAAVLPKLPSGSYIPPKPLVQAKPSEGYKYPKPVNAALNSQGRKRN